MIEPWKRNIVLVGFMGAGKSTIARELALRFNLSAIDTDQLIVDQYGRSISRIFAMEGEEGFRQAETSILKDLRDNTNSVVATGGGIVTREENWALMRGIGPVVFIEVAMELIEKRLSGDTGRPLADGLGHEEILERYRQRYPLYQKADIVLQAGNDTPVTIASNIVNTLVQKNALWKF